MKCCETPTFKFHLLRDLLSTALVECLGSDNCSAEPFQNLTLATSKTCFIFPPTCASYKNFIMSYHYR